MASSSVLIHNNFMRLLKDIDVSGKRVFVRGDLDVPAEQLTVDSSQLTEAARLRSLKPTVDWLLENGAKQIVIAGHIGRPSDQEPATRDQLSTKKLISPLERILGFEIVFSPDVILSPKDEESQYRSFADAQDDSKMVNQDNRIILLENLRFWPGEEANDLDFAKELAALADVYVNDAFAVCHREHASVVALAGLLPHAAGLHLEEEISQLTNLINNPQRPMVAIVGGAKLETKIPVIDNLAKVADWVLVGGAIAKELQMSNIPAAAEALAGRQYPRSNDKIVVATMTENTKDINQDSIEKFKAIISGAKTVVWNGPVGLFEEGFSAGTKAVAEAIVASGAFSVVGGGETVEFLASQNLLGPPAGGFSFVSSGGGAMLEFLAGKDLPGIEALE